MRIALFTDTFPPEVNGVANTVERSAKELAKRGHTVCVFTVSKLSAKELRKQSGGAYGVETIPSLGVPIYLGVRVVPPVGLALRKIARFKPDILHAHTPFSLGWEAVWAARFLNVPLVGTHHTFFDYYLKHIHLDYSWAKHLTWKLTVWYYNRCDLVISPTRSLADGLVENGLKRPHEVLANGTDTDFFRPSSDKSQSKSRLGLSEKVLIHLGRLSYEKSVDEVIRAFALLLEKEKDATLVIVGDGPSKAELEALARELGIERRVRFTGFILGKELLGYLQAGDVFVSASKSENMPLAFIEAMATALPIVAVRSLGLTEMIEHEKNGYLVAPGDRGAIAGRSLTLLQNVELRERFGAHSRTLSEKYSEAAVTERLEHTYTKVREAHART